MAAQKGSNFLLKENSTGNTSNSWWYEKYKYEY